jgi:uncharacterized protein (TIGR00730 family)
MAQLPQFGRLPAATIGTAGREKRQYDQQQGILMGDRRRNANGQYAAGHNHNRQRNRKLGRPRPRPIRNICVYCGSSPGINPAYARAAGTLGRLMAERGVGLVYGGGGLGLMGELARTVLASGGRVIGIIPEFLSAKERMLRDATELIVVADMHDRKRLMFDRSDAFVALPGGIGTLEELVEQLTWAQLGRHNKPIVLLDIEGFWSPLVNLLAHLRREGFIRDGMEVHFGTVDRAEDVLEAVYAAAGPVRQEADASVAEKF